VSRYQKSITNLDFTEARDSEWQWHQLGRMQVCITLQTDNHTSTPPLSFFTGRMPFLPPNKQRQSTEGHLATYISIYFAAPVASLFSNASHESICYFNTTHPSNHIHVGQLGPLKRQLILFLQRPSFSDMQHTT